MGQFVDWVKKTFIGGEDEDGYDESTESDKKIAIAEEKEYRRSTSHEKHGNVASINQTVQLSLLW